MNNTRQDLGTLNSNTQSSNTIESQLSGSVGAEPIPDSCCLFRGLWLRHFFAGLLTGMSCDIQSIAHEQLRFLQQLPHIYLSHRHMSIANLQSHDNQSEIQVIKFLVKRYQDNQGFTVYVVALHTYLAYYSTLTDNCSLVAKHIRHFRSENPTPTLNPPRLYAASVSANTNKTPPFTSLFSPFTIIVTPCSTWSKPGWSTH